MAKRFVIIGGGPGGNQAATHAARLGAEVTLIEKDIVGGAAHLLDCIPSKAMIATGGALSMINEARGMGLDLILTEFDVNDTVLPADPAQRDAITAAVARDYLDLMFDYREVKQLLAWGLADKYSWLQTWWPRPDGLAKRPTLYDADLRPKPLREAVAAALRGAPERTPWA